MILHRVAQIIQLGEGNKYKEGRKKEKDVKKLVIVMASPWHNLLCYYRRTMTTTRGSKPAMVMYHNLTTCI